MGTWVDLSKELPGGSTSPARTTPVPFGGESDYMRMLREAQVPDHYFHKNLCLPSSSRLSSGNCPGLHNSDSCTHFLNQKEKAQINITFFLGPPLNNLNQYQLYIFSERNFGQNFCTRLSHHISLCLAGKTVKHNNAYAIILNFMPSQF